MNEMQPDPRQRLLNDILQDEPGTAAAAAARQHAMAEFRRGRFLRRIAMTSRLAAVIVALAIGCFLFRVPLTNVRSSGLAGSVVSAPPKQAETTETMRSTPLPTLTDEQLLASFPPDTCYLAEVEGRKILVFADSTVRRKYLH
jgi:hypothetical protein